MNQLTYLIAHVCFSATKGSDWISAFKLEEDFEDVNVPEGATNDPATLANIIHELDEEQRDTLEASIQEMIEEGNLY